MWGGGEDVEGDGSGELRDGSISKGKTGEDKLRSSSVGSEGSFAPGPKLGKQTGRDCIHFKT